MRNYYFYTLQINIAVATKRDNAVGRHVAGINGDCILYDTKNVGHIGKSK
jgi:hypothetical protein